MTHAHNQGLLPRLGFADPDKGNPRHNRACIYLNKDAQFRLREIVARHHDVEVRSIKRWRSDTEVQLSQGKTFHLLFADLVVEYGIYHDHEQEPYLCGKLGVEVKIDPKSKPDDCKRQIRLYTNKSDVDLWVLAIDFRLTEDFSETISNAEILELGEPFSEWHEGFSAFASEYSIQTIDHFNRWVRECGNFKSIQEVQEFYARPSTRQILANIHHRDQDEEESEEERINRCRQKEAAYQIKKGLSK